MADNPSPTPLRVLVVDDTAVYRRIVGDVLGCIPNVIVVGTAANGRMALNRLKTEQVDFMILDLEMPDMDGLATLREARLLYPELGVVMLSGCTRLAADMTVRALELGALDFLAKGTRDSAEENRQELLRQLSVVIRSFITQRSMRQLRSRMTAVQESFRAATSSGPPPAGSAATTSTKPPVGRVEASQSASESRLRVAASPRPSRIDVVVIGTSTGGPQALAEVLPALPADFSTPVLVVQHMPPVFTASLAQSLNQKSRLEVIEAQHEQVVKARQVLIAPGGRHMLINRVASGAGGSAVQVVLNDDPPENSCRPSVDVLFRSAGMAFGRNVLAVVMTGMGEDGLRGVRALKERGCYCVTQDASSCTIYGMPRAIDQAGLSDESVALRHIAARVASLTRGEFRP
jgi:two-component system chemotaxis response regulator CheB